MDTLESRRTCTQAHGEICLQCVLQQKSMRHCRRPTMGAFHFEGEKLPPTQNTVKPHIQRVNFISRRDNSYKEPRSILPHPKDNGWEQKADGKLELVSCLDKPAPLELVKCGCKWSCRGKANCSGHKNGLSCTALCKCADCGNIPDYRINK